MNIEKLKDLTQRYIEETDRLIAGRKFGEGLFGMPDSARSSPIHMDYYNAVEATVKEICESEPSSETAAAVVRFLLTAERDFPCSKLAEWTLVAIQNHALLLIPKLSAAERAELYEWYKKAVPRLQRMPNQEKIAKALKQ